MRLERLLCAGLVVMAGMAWAGSVAAACPAAVRTSEGSRGQSGLPSDAVVGEWRAGRAGSSGEDKPTIAAFIPASNPTKTAVVIAPGGGYQHLSMVKEGADVAAWLNAHGVAAFVLKYRLGPKYHNPIELGDAQRAIRTVRANAAQYGIAPDHIGMWGFSAGGHLTASAGTMFDAGNAAATDPIEQQMQPAGFSDPGVSGDHDAGPVCA